MKQAIKNIIFDRWFPRAYAQASRQPVVPGRVLFVETKELGIPDSFKVLYDRLKANSHYVIEYVSLRQTHVSNARYYVNCAEMLKKAATAEVVFLNDASNVISCISLRKETRVVQLWHACGAFKRWGMSTANLKFGGSREEKLRHPFYENLSLVTTSSPEVQWAYAEAMGLQGREKIIEPIGVSRTDVFFDKTFLADACSLVEDAVPESKGRRVLLYAPTFRGKVSVASAPDKLDVRAFREAFEDEYVLLVKHHPFVKQRPAIPEDCRRFAFDVSDCLPIDVLLSAADVCISDYSSLVFEYSIFRRPMVFFAYDKDDYDDWRGFYYDYSDLTPGPVFETNEEMIDYLQHLDERFDGKVVEAFRARFMSACDGHATDRIIESVFESEQVSV